MPSGSCLCGKIAYEYSGNPVTTAICHCTDCQKWSGSDHSANLAVATEAFTVTAGTPATFTRKGTTGKDHVHAFCSNCGTSLYSQPEFLGSVTLIKTGTLDDVAIRDLQVANELFVKDRLNFGRALEGAVQYVDNLGGSTV